MLLKTSLILFVLLRGYIVKEQGYSLRILTIEKLETKLRESMVNIISNQMFGQS